MVTRETKERVKSKQRFCGLCGSEQDLTIDHVIPLAEGGTNDEQNLRVLCQRCNFRKGPVPPLWQRILNLFNGNFYWFKNDVRADLNSLHNYTAKQQRDMRGQMTGKFGFLERQFASLESTNKMLVEKFANVQRQNRILSERVLALQHYHKIEWDDVAKTYRKILSKRVSKEELAIQAKLEAAGFRIAGSEPQ
jgi:hypothetical protein